MLGIFPAPAGPPLPSGCGLLGLCFCMVALELAGPPWEEGGICPAIPGVPGPCQPWGMELLLAPLFMFMPGPGPGPPIIRIGIMLGPMLGI